jgi:hypothetical protein
VSDTISICFTGDLVVPSHFVERAQARGTNPLAVLAAITPVARKADLVVVNLEGPIGKEGTPRPDASFLLQNDGVVLDWLKQFPACVCGLANNHIMDLGLEGLERTLRSLSSGGLPCVGAGRNRIEAEAELTLTIKGQKLAFVAYTTDELHVRSALAGDGKPGAASLRDLPRVLANIKRLKAGGAHVIVALHWGHEYHQYPSGGQVETARAIVQAGAKLVIGHHPHTVQGFEHYNGSLIVYSLGNLLLPPLQRPDGRKHYRKRVSRQFMLALTDLDPAGNIACRFPGGICPRDMTLQLYAAGGLKRFQSLLADLSEPLKRPDYGDFWRAYRTKRQKQLERELLLQALCKFAAMPFDGSLSTLSIADLKRNLRRLKSAVIGG